MNHLRIICALSLIFMLFSCNENEPVELPIEDDPEKEISDLTIKEKAAFNIGAAVIGSSLSGDYSATLTEHYSQISGEFEMKMNFIWAGEEDYTWGRADALVNFAKDNDMAVHGHTLLWYSSYPEWFKNANYDSAAFETNIKQYIEAVVGRYKGNVHSWDVANEIFLDDGSFRTDGCPVMATFNDPVAFYGRCYQYVKDTDPDAKLFYNDYNVVLAGGKRNAMKQMVARFRTEGFPIDGLGDQFHYRVATDRNTIRNGLLDMASTGLLIHISELDIRINIDQSDTFIYSEAEQQKHAAAYEDYVSFYEEIPQNQKFAITTWGVYDGATWLTDWWHPREYPLLFDENFNKKETYEGFLRGLND